MGMSGTTYNSRSNEITKGYYNHLLSVTRDLVYTVLRRNGSLIYTTYHTM